MKKREEIRAHFQLKHSLYFTLYADNEPIKCWNWSTRNPERWAQKQKQYAELKEHYITEHTIDGAEVRLIVNLDTK